MIIWYCYFLFFFKKGGRGGHLSAEPWIVLCESLPVGLGCDGGIQEAVLDSRCGADVFIKELLPRLLRDGFSRHSVTYTHTRTQSGQSETEVNSELEREKVKPVRPVRPN